MAKYGLGIAKGDNYSVLEYDSKTYIMDDSAPFSEPGTITYFKDDGTGTLVDSEDNPIQAVELTALHIKTFTLDSSDVIFSTAGKLFHAVTDVE